MDPSASSRRCAAAAALTCRNPLAGLRPRPVPPPVRSRQRAPGRPNCCLTALPYTYNRRRRFKRCSTSSRPVRGRRCWHWRMRRRCSWSASAPTWSRECPAVANGCIWVHITCYMYAWYLCTRAYAEGSRQRGRRSGRLGCAPAAQAVASGCQPRARARARAAARARRCVALAARRGFWRRGAHGAGRHVSRPAGRPAGGSVMLTLVGGHITHAHIATSYICMYAHTPAPAAYTASAQPAAR